MNSLAGSSKSIGIFGMPMLPFSVILAVTLIAAFLNLIPRGMIGALLVMIALGSIMEWVGDNTPVLNNYLGGAPLVCIIGTAALIYLNVFPSDTVKTVSSFMKEGGFLDFYIAALITGSILGIESKVLVKAGSRYAVPLVAGVLSSFLLAAFTGMIIGYGWKEGIMYIAMPIMGGGMGAGAVPMSQIFEQFTNMDLKTILSILIPALALGNVLSIIGAGLLDKLGRIKPALTGNGQLIKGYKLDSVKEKTSDISMLGIGLLVSCGFFVVGIVESEFLEKLSGLQIHSYALMIITVAIVKIFNLLPVGIQDSANMWYRFVAKNFTAALLVGIGAAYTDFNSVINAISVQYIILVTMVVVGAVLGAGFAGMAVGFNFVESALTAGLCMSNMGGTGDVAVLTAAKRMELMPFAQISSRLGGALILLLVTILLPLLR